MRLGAHTGNVSCMISTMKPVFFVWTGWPLGVCHDASFGILGLFSKVTLGTRSRAKRGRCGPSSGGFPLEAVDWMRYHLAAILRVRKNRAVSIRDSKEGNAIHLLKIPGCKIIGHFSSQRHPAPCTFSLRTSSSLPLNPRLECVLTTFCIAWQ